MILVAGESEGIGYSAKLGMVAGGRLVEVGIAVANGASFIESVEDGFPRMIGVFYKAVVWISNGDFVWDAGGGSLM